MTKLAHPQGVTEPRRMNSPTLKKKPLEQGPGHFPRVIDTRAVNFRSLYCIAASLFTYLAFNFAINSGENVNRSFLLAITGGLLALVPLMGSEAGRVLGTGKLGLFLLIVYVFKTIASVTHFLFYIQPDYFDGNAEFSYFWDYMWLDQSLTFVADTWHVGGLFSPIGADYWQENKNAGLLAFMSLSYYFTGNYPLSIVPWNVLFTIYSAVLISDITKKLGGGGREVSLAIWIAALFPFSFIGSLMWRDTTGQFLIVLGAYLIVLTRFRLIYWLLLVPAGAFLAYLHREPYLMVFIAAPAAFVLNEVRKTKYAFALAPIIGVLLLVSIPMVLRGVSFSLFRYTEAGGGAIDQMLSPARLIGLPFRCIRAILGPFPWTQYFKQVDGYAYQPFDYLQSVLNLAMLMCAVPIAWRLWKMKHEFEICTLLALLFFLMGVLSGGVHTSYISVGLILLIPMLTHVGAVHFRKILTASLLFFVVANIIVVGFGFSGLNIMQNLSGGY
ncbi:MAG: hypothetical protein RL077_4313 [Verrucomicrobiota bacterium]|jgi:hypothetical protein